MFLYAPNPSPPFDFYTAGITDEARVSAFLNTKTNYKLVNRLQVKMGLTLDLVTGSPVVPPMFNGLPIPVGTPRAEIGDTLNPCGIPAGSFPNTFQGQAGPRNANSTTITGLDTISMINEGSPDAGAVRAFNTLTGNGVDYEFYWENIGSSITFTAAHGTSPILSYQQYPTYAYFVNGIRVNSFPEADDPLAQFQRSPYPFGSCLSKPLDSCTANCVRLFGTTAGGRCGDGHSFEDSVNSSTRTPPFIIVR